MITFPVLLGLAKHHSSKLDYSIKFEKQITELMGKIPEDVVPFPAHLSPQEQGEFMLGYYHQNMVMSLCVDCAANTKEKKLRK